MCINNLKKTFLIIMLLTGTMSLLACSYHADNKGKQKANVVFHHEIIINKSVAEVWPQLLEFVGGILPVLKLSMWRESQVR